MASLGVGRNVVWLFLVVVHASPPPFFSEYGYVWGLIGRDEGKPGKKDAGVLFEHSRVCDRDQGDAVEDIHDKRTCAYKRICVAETKPAPGQGGTCLWCRSDLRPASRE
jgi:hypothetical protein